MKFLLGILLTLNAFALEVKQNTENVSMAISATQNMLEVQIEAPMDLLLGFAKKPETQQELAQWTKLQELWFKKISQLVSVENNHCLVEETSVEYEIEQELSYGEVLGKVVFKCSKKLEATAILIKLKERFPKIQAIDATIFSANETSRSVVLSNRTEKITL